MLYLLNNKECMCTYVQLHIYDVIHFALNIHPLNSIHEFLVLRPPPTLQLHVLYVVKNCEKYSYTKLQLLLWI